MKKLFSLFLALLLMLGAVPATSAAGSEQEKAAETLYELGLFRGTGTNPDGTPIFDLEKTPSRNQAVIMLVRLLGKENEALAGNWNLPFTDVAKGSTAYPYIGYAYANGLTNGTSATTYSGTKPIKANQYITFVLRALGYTSGKDFSVGSAWEFSDQIGLTDGSYSAATTNFTRGDVAVISCSALSIHEKGTVVPLQQKLEEEKQGGHRAWFYVDEMGGLSIQTNIDARSWNGYSTVIIWQHHNHSWDIDTQSGWGNTVAYYGSSTLSGKENNTVFKNPEFYIFKGAESREIFWEYFETMRSHEKAAAALGDRFVGKIDLNTRIRIEEKPTDFQLNSLTITENEATQEETYIAEISGEIKQEGEYGLHYIGTQGGSMSHIGRCNGVLTFTREIGHFTRAGMSGTFWVSHCAHSINQSEIVCTKSMSNGFKYTFQ